jgi:hypothetical protein
MKVVCSGTANVWPRPDRSRSTKRSHRDVSIIFRCAPPAGRMMGAIFVTDYGNLLHNQNVISIRQIRFLPEPRQLFITVAESRLPCYRIGLEGSPVQSWVFKKERTQRSVRIQLTLQTTEAQNLPEVLRSQTTRGLHWCVDGYLGCTLNTYQLR